MDQEYRALTLMGRLMSYIRHKFNVLQIKDLSSTFRIPKCISSIWWILLRRRIYRFHNARIRPTDVEGLRQPALART